MSGVVERFRGHGLCAPESQRWVQTLGEGLGGGPLPLGGGTNFLQVRNAIESADATIHANGKGQQQIADLIDPVLAKVLNQ